MLHDFAGTRLHNLSHFDHSHWNLDVTGSSSELFWTNLELHRNRLRAFILRSGKGRNDQYITFQNVYYTYLNKWCKSKLTLRRFIQQEYRF